MNDSQWKHINDFTPPAKMTVLGFDASYSRCHVCEWDGERMTDDGEPRLVDEDAHCDDYRIEYWMELPGAPNVCRLEDE
jgi:hypothetical protein